MHRTIFILIIALFGFSIGWSIHVNINTVDHVLVTVWEKDRECKTSTDGDGNTTADCRYVVHTDSETFENTDSLLLWKFNSSDIHRNLRDDEQYCVKVVGYRIPLFSTYRNIVEIADSTQCEV